MRHLLLCLLVLAGLGCQTTPPAQWQDGGTPIVIPRARWVRGDTAVELEPDGTVRVGDTIIMRIDRAGRAYAPDMTPMALLMPDGYVVGPDNEKLGWVGAGTALSRTSLRLWLMILASGEVMRLNDEGDAKPFGVWLGCTAVPHTVQACTFVTHVLADSGLLGYDRNTRAPFPRMISPGAGPLLFP